MQNNCRKRDEYMQILLTVLTTTPTTSVIDDLLNPNSSLRSVIDLVVAILAIGGSAVAIILFIRGLWRKIWAPYREYIKFVDRVYSKDTRKAIAKYYIPTRAQDIDPCEFDEIRENNGNYITQLLVPFFCNDAFKASSQGKYYLVLADSGMGKTTFLLRLFRECLFNRSIRKRLSTKMIPLSQDNCLQSIQNIDNQENTILLLDALDENTAALKDYESFFADLLKSTEGFNKVVITCRTQFFPNRASEPVETGRIRVGTGAKKEEIIKKYISPFSDEEVKQYLKKQYRFNKEKQNQAYQIITKVPALMARPVILNWINFLCDSTEEYKYSYQIYSKIIEKWIERECIGHTDNSLYELSRTIASYMYMNNTTSMSATQVEEIAARKNIQLTPIIAKSRSLLNRNGNGEYKFAHRSFLEYFIVFGLFQKMQIPANLTYLFNHSGIKRFFYEILLDAAQKSNIEEYENSMRFFDQIKSYIRMDTPFDLINHKDAVYNVTNTTNGFSINTALHFKESEFYDQQHILHINDKAFVDLSQPNTIRFRKQTICMVGLSITAKASADYPHVTIKFYSDIAKNKIVKTCGLRLDQAMEGYVADYCP